MQERHIVITGSDGAGKSSVISEVSQAWTNAKVPFVNVSIWDPLKSSPLFQKKNDVDQYLVSLTPAARACFIFHCYYESLRQARKKTEEMGMKNPIYLHDSYFHKYLVMEAGWGARGDWLIELCAEFPRPAVVIELTASAETATKRKNQTSRYERGPEGNFQRFQGQLHSYWQRLRTFESTRETPWIGIATDSLPLSEVVAQSLSLLKAYQIS